MSQAQAFEAIRRVALQEVIGRIDDLDILRGLIMESDTQTSRVLEELHLTTQAFTLAIEGAELDAQDAQRYTLLKHILPHMLQVIAYAAQFRGDLHEQLALLDPEKLDAILDTRIANGDLEQLLDQLDDAAEAKLDAEQEAEATLEAQRASQAAQVAESEAQYA